MKGKRNFRFILTLASPYRSIKNRLLSEAVVEFYQAICLKSTPYSGKFYKNVYNINMKREQFRVELGSILGKDELSFEDVQNIKTKLEQELDMRLTHAEVVQYFRGLEASGQALEHLEDYARKNLGDEGIGSIGHPRSTLSRSTVMSNAKSATKKGGGYANRPVEEIVSRREGE